MIYLDNAATTRVAPEVLEAMLPYLTGEFGNPGGIYSLGSRARKAVGEAREQVASLIAARPEEIFFTSGGTEADNWALSSVLGNARSASPSGSCRGHIITTKIEHHAVLRTCESLTQLGFEVTCLPVDPNGLVVEEELKRAIRPDTILISVMTANNEVGTLEPILSIGEIAREKGILFHTDAVQAFGQIPLDVRSLPVDLLSASAHKLNGPKGMGCLYVRKGVKLAPLLHGGAQERSRRAGTENVPGIVGFGAAAARSKRILPEKVRKEQELRDHMIRRFLSEIPDCHLNGHEALRLPGNVNVTFSGVHADSLLLRLDAEGICASAGSACTSGSAEPSHVLTALGLSAEEAKGTVRFSLGEENTKEEIDETVECVKKNVSFLREKILNSREKFCDF